ncbi:MAG: hypothetical protein J0H42_25715 [Rhizobiales bacterium]|nr:hypothetical protein [Hyphomicrobiales bacterium]
MTESKDQRQVSQSNLADLMSKVISLREKVAQAELAAHLYRITVAESGAGANSSPRAD